MSISRELTRTHSSVVMYLSTERSHPDMLGIYHFGKRYPLAVVIRCQNVIS